MAIRNIQIWKLKKTIDKILDAQSSIFQDLKMLKAFHIKCNIENLKIFTFTEV